jgi:hypothetical protein
LVFNAINAVTGRYLLDPRQAKDLADLARGVPVAEPRQLQELKYWNQRSTQATLGPVQGIDPFNPAETGWAIVFPADSDSTAIRDALKPLLDLRRSQASAKKEKYYQEFGAEWGYRPGESKQDFLARLGAGPGPADPENVPYYLLLVGDPEAIPFRFQYQLDVQYAVGRLWFGDPDGRPDLPAFAGYARSVVAAESGGQVALPRKAVLFGPRNTNDRATALSADDLVKPLADDLKGSTGKAAGWDVQAILADEATKARLGSVLGGPGTPTLLFTASHGLGFPAGHPRQYAEQGALVCQDWPGPDELDGELPASQYFSAADVDDSASLLGLITFHFACYGAGTPQMDDFAHSRRGSTQDTIAPHAFLAGLPRRLLGHPRGGALAVIGHVERAWGYSFRWARAGRQLQTFSSTLRTLMSGAPVGWATEFLNQRYAELSSDLSTELEEIRWGRQSDDLALAGMWTANSDARSFVILGDPAVRLPLAADGGRPRPALDPVVLAPTPMDPAG